MGIHKDGFIRKFVEVTGRDPEKLYKDKEGNKILKLIGESEYGHLKYLYRLAVDEARDEYIDDGIQNIADINDLYLIFG